jgi:hypothetical protein
VTNAEFQSWLETEVLDCRMTPQQRDDLLEQKKCFDRNRAEIEKACQQQVVGYVSGIQKVGATVHELLGQAQQNHPGRMVYFEPVGFELTGPAHG